MIEVTQVHKKFDDIVAVEDISVSVKEGAVFGMVGTNGAGKSTFLRMLAGVLKPDRGVIKVDDEEIYENERSKHKIFFISDEQYFFPNSSAKDMMEYYTIVYPDFDKKRFSDYMGTFHLDMKRKLHTFSKGMKRQVSILLGICANTKYLLCDETFDGLDPVMRQGVKSIFAAEIMNRDFTPIIASHNLRELEDICDHVGLLHQGGILFSKDLDDVKYYIHKIQCVIPETCDEEKLLKELEVLQCQRSGSLLTITARGTKVEVVERVEDKNPLFYEILPLTLEEIFISETEVVGYDIKSLIS